MQKQNVIILGHGSKSDDAIDDFNFVVESTKAKSYNKNVFGAHMELASPTLEEVVEQLSREGESEVVILPYFLYNGNHIKEDIPGKIEALKNLYPQLQISFGTPIGKEPLMADLLLKKVNELTSV